jgi:hypothetical protein
MNRSRVARPESSKGVVASTTPFEDSGRATRPWPWSLLPLVQFTQHSYNDAFPNPRMKPVVLAGWDGRFL